jgi:hypothetical protein
MFFNLKSRSTFLDRPRAKSEELMVVKQKFPHQMPDAQKKQNNSTQWAKLTTFVPKISFNMRATSVTQIKE